MYYYSINNEQRKANFLRGPFFSITQKTTLFLLFSAKILRKSSEKDIDTAISLLYNDMVSKGI